MNLRGYFDYNATTPMSAVAIEAFIEALHVFGNPSGAYGLAMASRAKIDTARKQVADLIGCAISEIVFTSGGTESNNYAIKGAVAASRNGSGNIRPHVVVSEIEHPSVLECVAVLERYYEVDVSRIKPDRLGRVSSQAVNHALRPNTCLVSIMLMNNEIGTLQPIAEIAQLLRPHQIHFHVDAVQAVGKIPVDVHELGVDSLAFAAHKFYGPKGVGGLFIREGKVIEPLLHGGGQEAGARAGTQAVAALIAMGAAAKLASANMADNVKRTESCRNKFIELLCEKIPNICIHGPDSRHERAPNTISVCLEGIRAEALAALLDQLYGIQISVGSACSRNKQLSRSHVLAAMGLDPAAIDGTFRVSLGTSTREEDAAWFVDAIEHVVKTLRRVGELRE